MMGHKHSIHNTSTKPVGIPTLVSVQFSSVAQSCPTHCDPMNRSTPGLPVHHQVPEFTHTHVHRVGDAIQASHPLSSPSPPALNLSSIRVFSNESVLPLTRNKQKSSAAVERQEPAHTADPTLL